MNSFYGGGGVESETRAGKYGTAPGTSSFLLPTPAGYPVTSKPRATSDSRSSALPASTLHGSQSGADPGPSNPAGCHLSYAREQSAPEPITNDYAALSGGW